MKHLKKYLIPVTFILLLFSAFALFAILQNASFKSFWAYLFIIIIIVSSAVLFGLSIQKQEVSDTQKEEKNLASTEETMLSQVAEATTQVQEDQIDVQKLLPSRSLEIEKFTEELLRNMADPFNMVQGLVYVKNPNEDLYHCYAQYAYFSENKPAEFRMGESLSGQAVKNKVIVTLNDIPDNFMTIASGLGKSNPKHLVFVPIKNQEDVVGLIEYATFEPLTEVQHQALEAIAKKVADTVSKHLKK